MASFISKILGAFSGASSDKPASGPSAPAQTHGDCTIHATPIREGNQFRLAGRIEKTVNGETLTRNFIRADIFPAPTMRWRQPSARRGRSSTRRDHRSFPMVRKIVRFDGSKRRPL